MINNVELLQEKQYLFRQMDDALRAFRQQNPQADIINMGIGDVVEPLAPVVVRAIRQAAQDMGDTARFRGYPPTAGYEFARQAVAQYYADMGIDVRLLSIGIGSGAKDELGIWSRIFDPSVPALIASPCYPAYVDVAHLHGRRVVYAYAAEAHSLPLPQDIAKGQYLVYLCSPNNPTGACYTQAELQAWVDYACDTGSVLLFDAAYAAFAYPYSIFSCRNAEYCCIEIGTLSKSASFSGMRFGWSTVGAKLQSGIAMRAYIKYKSYMTNGVSYIVQRAGEAALSKEGMTYSHTVIEGYKQKASRLADALAFWGLQCNVGPYVWVKVPNKISADPFGIVLKNAHIVVTDGRGFGAKGEGYMRLSVFALGSRVEEAIDRLASVLL